MSWRKTGGTRFHFAMESCPQNEHSKLERQDSLSEWNLVHKNSTETGATRSFFMESCPQKEHRHWSDKILFRHVVLSTERTEKQFRMSSQDLMRWCILLQSPLQYQQPCTFRLVTIQRSALHFNGILGFVLKPQLSAFS